MKQLILLLAAALCSYAQTTYVAGSLTVEGTTNYCGTDTGSGNTYVCTNPTNAHIGAYRVGHEYSFNAAHTNSGAATLSIDSLTATAIKKWSSGSLVDVASGDIQSGNPFTVRYNGTYFMLGGPANTSSGGGSSTPGGTSGQVEYNNSGAFGGFTVNGDATLNTSTGALTLSNSGVTSGTYGDATHAVTLAVDTKGRVTGVTLNTIAGGGGSTTRTWLYAVQGLCQAGVSNAAIWMPTTNAPSFTICDATHQQGEWQVPATTTGINWGMGFRVPAGVTGSYSLVLTWRTADANSAHALTITPSYACLSAGSNPDNPSYTSLSTFTVNPATASATTDTTYTFTPSCTAGSKMRVLLTASTNTITSPVAISYESVAMQASN